MRLSILSLIGTITFASSAYAIETPGNTNGITTGFFFKPYVGADYDYTSINYDNNADSILSDSLSGGDVHIGARIHKYLGFEGSYFDTASSSKNVGALNTSVKLEGYTLDAMGYLPVADKVELIGTAGVSRLKATLSLSGLLAGTGSEWETKGRIGGGAQYWITDNLNIRGLVRYQGADFRGIVNNAVISSLGINWQF